MICPICKHPYDFEEHIRVCGCCGIGSEEPCRPTCPVLCSTCWDNLDYFRDQVICQRAKEK